MVLNVVRMLGLAALAACASAPEEPVAAPRPTGAPAALGPGDVFEVRVFGEQDLSGDYRVGADGSIDFPLIGRIAVEGSTPAELSVTLATALKTFVRQPQVSIFVKELKSKKVYVFGQVQKPGTFNFEQGMNIIQAITLAGGFAQLANKSSAFVTRVVLGKEQRLEVSITDIGDGRVPNFEILPGDIIFVPESMF
jgi:protein involved in polysaccharide export with SLBB domain